MQNALSKLISKNLREVADKIDASTSELTEEEAMELLSVISHKVLSKEQACNFVGLQSSQFDNLIRAGKLPKGRKRRGHTALVWYEDELRDAISKIKLNKKS